jgi:hypothetical protein
VGEGCKIAQWLLLGGLAEDYRLSRRAVCRLAGCLGVEMQSKRTVCGEEGKLVRVIKMVLTSEAGGINV